MPIRCCGIKHQIELVFDKNEAEMETLRGIRMVDHPKTDVQTTLDLLSQQPINCFVALESIKHWVRCNQGSDEAKKLVPAKIRRRLNAVWTNTKFNRTVIQGRAVKMGNTGYLANRDLMLQIADRAIAKWPEGYKRWAIAVSEHGIKQKTVNTISPSASCCKFRSHPKHRESGKHHETWREENGRNTLADLIWSKYRGTTVPSGKMNSLWRQVRILLKPLAHELYFLPMQEKSPPHRLVYA